MTFHREGKLRHKNYSKENHFLPLRDLTNIGPQNNSKNSADQKVILLIESNKIENCISFPIVLTLIPYTFFSITPFQNQFCSRFHFLPFLHKSRKQENFATNFFFFVANLFFSTKGWFTAQKEIEKKIITNNMSNEHLHCFVWLKNSCN